MLIYRRTCCTKLFELYMHSVEIPQKEKENTIIFEVKERKVNKNTYDIIGIYKVGLGRCRIVKICVTVPYM